MIYGIDLSHANPDVNLHELFDAFSIDFVALKGTEGSSFVDPMCANRYHRIRDNWPQMPIIIYHFLRVDSSPTSQVSNLNRLLVSLGYGSPYDMHPAIDTERGLKGQSPDAALTQECIDLLTQVRGGVPGVYSGQSYWQDLLMTTRPSYKWVARYPSKPTIPYDIHQYTESMSFKGNNYDGNTFDGTVSDFVQRMRS